MNMKATSPDQRPSREFPIILRGGTEADKAFRAQFPALGKEPRDLEWNTRRVLELIQVSGLPFLRGMVIDMFSVELGKDHALWPHWEPDIEISRAMAQRLLDGHQLGDRSILFSCLDIMTSWTSRNWIESGEIILDPATGIRHIPEGQAVPDENGVPQGGELLFAYSGIANNREPRFWIEWVTDDWVGRGLIDVTDHVLSIWRGKEEMLVDLLDNETQHNGIITGLCLSELKDPAYGAALDRWFSDGDPASRIQFYRNEVAPHLILYALARHQAKAAGEIDPYCKSLAQPASN